MNEAHWNADIRPAWLDELAEEEIRPGREPGDGFKKCSRILPALSTRPVSAPGTARHWQFHPAILTVKRLMVITYLSAHGPATTMDLSAALGINISRLPLDLRRLVWVSLAAVRRVPSRLSVGGQHCHYAREWSITDSGRQALWRMAWVTRDILHAPWDDVPLRDDVEDDPVEAVRRHVVFFWLRPSGLQVTRILASPVWAPISMCRITRLSGMNNGTVWQILQYLRARGWLREHPESMSVGFYGDLYPKLSMNEEGVQALGRHVDALRRAGRSTGWTLDPDDPAYDIVDERGEFPICWEPEAARLGWRL